MHHHRKCRYSPGISRVSYTCDARDVVTYWQCPPRPPPRRRTRWTAHLGSDGPATPACLLASSPPPHARWTGRLVDWCPPLSLSSATNTHHAASAWGGDEGGHSTRAVRALQWASQGNNSTPSLALPLLVTPTPKPSHKPSHKPSRVRQTKFHPQLSQSAIVGAEARHSWAMGMVASPAASETPAVTSPIPARCREVEDGEAPRPPSPLAGAPSLVLDRGRDPGMGARSIGWRPKRSTTNPQEVL